MSDRARVLQYPDFVNAKRLGYSLVAVEERYPDGAPENVIATMLCITVEEVEQEYEEITEKLRRLMKV